MTAHAKLVFVVLLVLGLVLAATSALVRLGASDQGTQPKEQTARRAYDLLAEGFGPGFNGPIPIVVDVNGDARRAAAGLRRRAGSRGRRVGRRAAVQRRRRRSRIVFVTPDSAPQDEATETLVDRLRDDVVPAATEGSDAVVYVSGPERGVQGHRRPDHGTAAAVPALHHRRHVHRARDGVPVDRDLADGGDHDDPLRVRRLRRAHARDPGGPPARADRPRPDGADRDLRAPDRVRDPVRALDGLHGLPDEPDPGGARPRPEDAGGGRARDRRDRPGRSSPRR